MHFEVLQTLSVNGHPAKPNEDRCGSTAQLAWVVDGATDMCEPGLLGTQGGASWLASTASSAFATGAAADMRATCQAAFGHIEDAFARQKTREVAAPWEVPKAAFCAAQLTGGGLSVAWAADSPILLLSGSETKWCTGTPDTSAEAADALALGDGIGAQPILSEAAQADRRAHRARPDHVALSSNAAASAAATRYADITITIGDELLLMSDGFASLVTDYGRYTTRELARALQSGGLWPLMQDIRAIEQADAACLRFPRFKVSDDATAVWLKVAG